MGPWIEVGRIYGTHKLPNGDWTREFVLKRGQLLDVAHTGREGVETRSQMLIGDVNEANGGCGCCGGIEANDFIVRYRMVDIDV